MWLICTLDSGICEIVYANFHEWLIEGCSCGMQVVYGGICGKVPLYLEDSEYFGVETGTKHTSGHLSKVL